MARNLSSTNIGTCFICQQAFDQRAMTRHLANCLSPPIELKDTPAETIFLLKLASGPQFWLYVEIRANACLKDLDFFLRKLWLECCGHMSVFTVKGQQYSSPHLRQPLAHVLNPTTVFTYEYDMGNTTEIEGKVIAVYQSHLAEAIRLVARNNMPDFMCSTCRTKPEKVCSICFDYCCSQCRKKHACEEDEFMLPIVNSPRMGVCGYTGTD